MSEAEIEAFLNSLPLEYIIYGMTILIIILTVLVLKKCNYTWESILAEVIESECDVELNPNMDLNFIFPKIINYLEGRIEKESKKNIRLKLCMICIKSKFVQSIILKYIRKIIIPKLIASKRE